MVLLAMTRKMRLKRRHRPLVAAAAVGLTFSVAAPVPVRANPETRRYAYVAQDFYVIGPDLAAQMVARKTGHHVAPLGTIRVVPAGTQVTFTIDDFGTAARMIDVTVGQRTYEHRCVAVDHPTVVDGLVPGRPLTISIWAATYGPWTPCGAGGTTGTLTISGSS